MSKSLRAKSMVTRATTTSRSLRTTIPVKIVDELGIEDGDVLDWRVEERDGHKVAVIKKLE